MREHESREPFAYIIQDKYERERGIEGHLSRSHVSKYVSQEDINEHEITCTPLYLHAQPAPVVPEEMTPEMMRAVQLNSELGKYAASNLSGAYGLFAEFWRVACRAAILSGGKS